MDKNKRNFRRKLYKQSKKNLIDLVCNLIEENFHYEIEVKNLTSLVFSHQQSLKFALSNQNPKMVMQEVEVDDSEEDEEPFIDKTKKESVRSYV